MILNLPKGIEIKEKLLLSKYSSFKIGGECDIAIFPKNTEEFVCVVNTLTDAGVRFDVVGNGSNILFDDKGYRGALIFTQKMNEVQYTQTADGEHALIGCGKKLTELAGETLKKRGLSGLEFAYGIPGSVGGAVYMNAGAYGGEMSQIVLESVCYNSETREVFTLSAENHKFSYRHSYFQENKNCFVLSTLISLGRDTDGSALERALKNMESRKEKQPLEYPNAGSTFKRPDGFIAAKLIDDCGLKGMSVGDAEVSTKHAGFFINKGHATSADILALAEIVKENVREKFSVTLELEIIYVPEK